MANSDEVIVLGEGLTLSQIVWRRARAPYPGQVEAVLEANRHLADAGFVLPVGTRIEIPADPQSSEEAVDVIRLW